MKGKLMLVAFCIFLLVTSSLNVAAFDFFDRENDKNNLGEVILINVDHYEPTSVSSDYLRNKNFPVY